MKLHTFLFLAVGALRLAGCASEPDGTTVSGSVALTRESGAETGQTGFSFPDRTLLDEPPFAGSCTFEDGVASIIIERTAPDAFGLSSFALELPLETPIEAGSAKVTAVVGGTTFQDASGSCVVGWTNFDETMGFLNLQLDCAALAGGDSPETVGLSANLSLDGCE